MTDPSNMRILLTGFGPFLNITNNPSSSLLSRPSFPTTLTHRHLTIHLLAHPSLPAEYHSLLITPSQLLSTHGPLDAIIHFGLAADRTYFAIERSAPRDGYNTYPDMARRVVTKADGAKFWGKAAPERLEGEWEWEELVRRWEGLVGEEGKGRAKKGGKGKGGGGSGSSPGGGNEQTDVRLSDDVGTYVCGLLYYASMEVMGRKARGEGRTECGGRVLFCHVPPMESEAELAVGERVVLALVKAVAEQIGQ